MSAAEPRYRTFLRTARDWHTFARARKRSVDSGLTLDEAQRACRAYNEARTQAQRTRGTVMEFERDGSVR